MRWIRDRAFPVRNALGEIYRIAGLSEDITERKRTRELLQTQAAIVENMAEAVVVTDDKGLVVQMNPAGERIWGYERGEVLGQPASMFSALPEPEAATVLREVLDALQSTGAWRGTFKNRRKDGAVIYCEAVINRLAIQGQTLMVAVGAGCDGAPARPGTASSAGASVGEHGGGGAVGGRGGHHRPDQPGAGCLAGL